MRPGRELPVVMKRIVVASQMRKCTGLLRVKGMVAGEPVAWRHRVRQSR